MSERSPGQRVLYLDMNVWVDMAKGLREHDVACSRAIDQLIEAVDEDRIIVPISAAHYLELWHRRRRESRETIAALMRDVSRYATIPSAHVVRQLEARALAQSWTSGILAAVKLGLVGHGAAHAFGRPEGRFRFVERVASPDGAIREGVGVAPDENWDRPIKESGLWEWFQLVGHQGLLEDPAGLDRTPEHRFGSDTLERELRLRAQLKQHPLPAEKLRDLMDVDEFESMREYIADAILELGHTPPPALTSGGLGPESADVIRDVIRSIPSADTWSTLRYLKHRDLGLPWEQHDWTDLAALSVAIPYCDAVITEKRWVHLANASGLSTRYNTTVTTGVSGILTQLSKPAVQ
jgi:hypothetical protein